CLASRPCKQRCTYVSTCCTKPALAFAWPDRVSFMRGSSFRFQIRVFRIILPVSCFDNPLPYFLESMPPGSPVQYTVTCNMGNLVLYGRPSRSPWQSNCLPGNHSQTLARNFA